MKPVSIAIALAAMLAVATTANAWLGDSLATLNQSYGNPLWMQSTTGDIPTQKGQYAELKESYGTNVSLIAQLSTNYDETGYGMDLVEIRTRYLFVTNGLSIAVYIGNGGETYNGTDFSGRSAREILRAASVWQKDSSGDKFTHPLPIPPSVVDAFLEHNQGDSTWVGGWQPYSAPGLYLRHTVDKTRLAIGQGPSENQLYRVEVRMVNDKTRAVN
jgi:hypothetical protein